ncbi:hypothetical protein ABGV40_14900 [Paenibacillus amylolyticus]|uniref:hypothetical protein n=1 Tax=Paenibacillus amylolyticus TaxID=1451 RepID=UPI003241DA1E
MPEKSGFFDSTAADVRAYPAREFALYFSRFIGNGVFKGGTALKVDATGSDSNISINVGYGWINGYMYRVYDSPQTLAIQPASTQDRIDRIILRLNTSTPVRAITAMVLQGAANASPVPPTFTRAGDIYDLSLAQVLVKANSSIVLPQNITDERLNTEVCGIVTGLVEQADTTLIFNQFQGWYNTKTVEFQKEWDDFMEGLENDGFATTVYVKEKADAAEANARAYAKSYVNYQNLWGAL